MTAEIVLAEKVKALKADEEIQKGLRRLEVGWVEVSLMVLNFRKHEWYRPLGFDHFNAWMESRVAESRASLYKKMRIVESLAETIPVSTLQTLPITNCEILVEVPPSKRLEMVGQAKTLPTAEFAALVEQVPGNGMGSKEWPAPMTFMVGAGQKKVIDRALSKMMETGDDPPTRRADALEYICQGYLDGD